MIVIGILLILGALYLLSLKPAKHRPEKLFVFKNTYIAHRGLFNNRYVPENSLRAFANAADHGYGIELDVQMTADEELVVFHDSTLKRMCNVKKRVSDCTFEELCSYNLLATDQKIPLFEDVLRLIGSRVPLLIEVKAHGDVIRTTVALDKILRTYTGTYAVQSFHPAVCAWYKKYRPNVPRGILSTDYKKNKMKLSPFRGFIMTNLMANFYAKPDFIAYNHKYADQFSYKLARKLYKFDNAAWTIRTPEELNAARRDFSIFIFDSFIP